MVELNAPTKICTGRYSGGYQANSETATRFTSAVDAMQLSIRRGSTFAWTTPSVQLRQTYFEVCCGESAGEGKQTSGMLSAF